MNELENKIIDAFEMTGSLTRLLAEAYIIADIAEPVSRPEGQIYTNKFMSALLQEQLDAAKKLRLNLAQIV